MKELQDKLSAHRSSTPSRWREKAMERQANKEWLRYSQKIAMMMLDKMEELGITQKAVAERMGCSQQYISRVLKGSEIRGHLINFWGRCGRRFGAIFSLLRGSLAS